VINAVEIQKKEARLLPEVLRDVLGLHLVQNGAEGKQASVFLRGTNSDHTLVLIDGVRVNSTTTGGFDFSAISVDDIERIEVLKGPQSTLYGSDAIGGVINIITKRGRGKPRLGVSTEVGTQGTYKASATLSGSAGQVGYRLSTGYFSTEGVSAYKDGTEADGYRNAYISAALDVALSPTVELSIRGRYLYDRNEIDAFGADDPDRLIRQRNSLISARATVETAEFWSQSLTVFSQRDAMTTSDGGTVSSRIIVGRKGLDWQHTLRPLESLTVVAGAELREDEGENEGNFQEDITSRALYVNTKLLAGRLVFNAGLRSDNHETAGTETTYRLGALWRLPEGFALRGSYGTGFKAPDMNDLFWPSSPWASGNPDLKPERSRGWEVGLEKSFTRAKASVVYFRQEVEDLIDWQETSPWFWQPVNVAEAEIKGLEAELSARPVEALLLQATYTWLEAKDATTGETLPRRPEHRLTLSADYGTDRWGLRLWALLVGEAVDGGETLDAYQVLNLAGRYSLGDALTLFARVENLLDEDYEEAKDYGTKGFSAYAGVRMSF
jgi:vitamin B12 transporter